MKCLIIEYIGDYLSFYERSNLMKNKNQLLQELESFGSFAISLTDLSEEFLNEPLFEDVSIKSILAMIYFQDKLYLEYYFPLMKKGAQINEYDKTKIDERFNAFTSKHAVTEIINFLIETRKNIISFLTRIPQEQFHAFFEIDGVKFTMYDHIENIIWNDQIQKDEILKYII